MKPTPANIPERQHSARTAAGFTLIEILAATAIMVLITFFILSMTTNVLTGWSASKSALSGNYEAKIALDKLAQDIESAIFRRNGKEWFVIETASDSDSADESLQLMFYASVPDRPREAGGIRSPSDVCAVKYSIRYRNLFGRSGQHANEDFALYRTLANPRETFNEALALNSPRVYWALPTVDSGQTQHLLSRDVAAIRIDVAYRDIDGVKQIAEDIEELTVGKLIDPDNEESTAGDEITIIRRGGTEPIPNVSRLLYLDISIGVLGDEGSFAFHHDHDPDLAGSAGVNTIARINAIINRYGSWYTRRVVIRSTPL